MANECDFRSASSVEVAIIKKMLDIDLPEAGALRDQLSSAQVRSLDDYGSLEFDVKFGPKVSLRDGPIVNAIQKDHDTVEDYGPFINFVLFLKSGVLDELQIYKSDGNPIIETIDPGKIISVYEDRRQIR